MQTDGLVGFGTQIGLFGFWTDELQIAINAGNTVEKSVQNKMNNTVILSTSNGIPTRGL